MTTNSNLFHVFIFCLKESQNIVPSHSDFFSSSLIGLGNYPSLCVLLDEIFETFLCYSLLTVHIICPEQYYPDFQKELSRWFPFKQNICLISMNDRVFNIIEEIEKLKPEPEHRYLFIYHEFPLLSSSSLLSFLKHSESKYFTIMSSSIFDTDLLFCDIHRQDRHNSASKSPLNYSDGSTCFLCLDELSGLMKKQNYEFIIHNTKKKKIIINKNDQIKDIIIQEWTTTTEKEEQQQQQPNSLLIHFSMKVFYIQPFLFLKEIKKKKITKSSPVPQMITMSMFFNMLSYFEDIPIIERQKDKKEIYVMNTYSDKIFIENQYNEKKNREFLYHSYIQWKQCIELEKKIIELEKKINHLEQHLL